MLGLSAQWCHRSSLSVPLLSTFNLIAKCCCSLPVAFNSKFVTCAAHSPVPGARVCNPESMWGGIHWNHNEVPLREVLSIFPRQVPYTSAKLGRIEVQSLCLLPCMHAVHAERVDAKLWFLRERCTRIHTAVADSHGYNPLSSVGCVAIWGCAGGVLSRWECRTTCDLLPNWHHDWTFHQCESGAEGKCKGKRRFFASWYRPRLLQLNLYHQPSLTWLLEVHVTLSEVWNLQSCLIDAVTPHLRQRP